ncbi:iron-siderophore ABC transporter substrate-binding protein [uncultured Corynebacterium sp.]|uniref:iron-siderophore ABC transporter substrate-binding protein n=1 Tax=uncultured Corynebacterium sp. TaxID=159447 RepID=UPI0025D6EF35|nr:iron-siderophore ABC transporter substrate-binding protein [uncultured Corynebacterium sp.]
MGTRIHRTLTSVVAVGLTFGLAACSDNDNMTTGATGGSANIAFPATVSTKFGEIDIKEKPTKVVALGWGDAETAVALGVQPVAASDWAGYGGDGLGPWVTDRYDEDPEIISTQEPEYEKIAGLEPDLILDVKSSGDRARYDKLSAIAPTVGVPDNGADSFLTGPDQQVSMIAQALGETSKGEEILAARADRAAQIRDEHPQWAGKTLSAIGASKTWGVFLPGSVRVDPLMQLGFTLNDKISSTPAGKNGFSVSLTDETLGDADADIVLAYPIGMTGDEIADSEAWKRLPAVAAGHAAVLPRETAQA